MKVSQGYFLIELTIVIAIILMISTIAIPNFSFLNRQTLLSELEKLNLTFAYMQQQAIACNKNLSLKFVDAKRYFFDNNMQIFSKDIEFGFIKNLKGPPSCPLKLVEDPISYQDKEIKFFKNGVIQSGTIYLTDQNKNYQYALTTGVSQVSFIRKYKFENGQWILIKNSI